MKIIQLYVYPIKSLRGISITSSDLTQQGLQYDRRFMLLKVLPDGTLENMHISHFSEMSLFKTSINTNASTCDKKEVTVTYQTPKEPLVPFHSDQSRSLEVPLVPGFHDLESIDVKMHLTSTFAYKMPEEFNSWFSNCFGFRVILAYLGDGLRQALGNLSPNYPNKASSIPGQSSSSWLSSLSSYLPLPGQFQGLPEDKEASNDGITFSDCAPFLVVTLSSLGDIHPRLRETESPDSPDAEPIEMDMKKFRPNVVLDGENPWDEDFWGELAIVPATSASLPLNSNVDIEKENGFHNENEIKLPEKPIQLLLTANCGRCKSINVDYETGRPGTGPAGNALKKLMKDRRVDTGVKYSPIFGRYGFLGNWKEGVGRKINVGDEVVVSKRNKERTVFHWPGLTN